MSASVSLRPEITASDVCRLKQWTDDEAVMEYLNEKNNISSELAALLRLSNIPVYTPLFNRTGRFFMIDAADEKPVGFVRLVRRATETEIVLAVGERQRWGNGLGTAAIGGSLQKVFFEWRDEKVVAYIHPHNLRSERAFVHNGFSLRRRLPSTRRYEITLNEYLNRLRAASTPQ